MLVGAAAMATLAAFRLHDFLAVNAPVGARVLVVEGWMGPEELDQAAAAFRSGRYELLLTTGGPTPWWSDTHERLSHAEVAAQFLIRRGLPAERVIAVPTMRLDHERTYQSAVSVREWAERSGRKLEALDVFSEGTHARRSRLLYREAFGEKVRIGVLSARVPDYDAARWWRTSVGAREVLDQAIGFVWAKLFFRTPLHARPAFPKVGNVTDMCSEQSTAQSCPQLRR
jgi:hypothetical protein